jgi:Holliday junction resolvase
MDFNLPPYMQRNPSIDRKKKSEKQERATANEIGGRVVSGSGSGRGKGDVNVGNLFKIEAKRTDKESISLKKSWLQKIRHEAFEMVARPAMAIEIDGESWYMIRPEEFRALVKCLREE